MKLIIAAHPDFTPILLIIIAMFLLAISVANSKRK